MQPENSLLIEKYRAVTASVHINSDDVDYEVMKYHLPFLKQLDAIENSSVVLYDFLTRQYQFITSRFKFLIGYDRDTALQEGPEYFLKQIHPDDLGPVIETMTAAARFLQNVPAEEQKDFKLCFSFRIRHSTGTYIRLMQQVVTLELDSKGNPWLALILNDIITNDEADAPFRRFMVNIKDSKRYLFAPNDQQGADQVQKNNLSGRELEILGLMAKGLPSKQIADQLFISVNTVNNHRANILRKMQAGNAVEAVQYASRMGFV